MSNMHNTELLETFYNEEYDRLINAGFPPTAANYIAEKLAVKKLEELD
jgi:hypothetical protein